MNATSESAWQRRIASAFALDPRETPAVLAGFGMFLALFTGYFMLRPVRETLGIAGGIDNLPWLFTATFVATLAAQPLFGWIASRAPRHRILDWTYAFFVANLIVFALVLPLEQDHAWTGRVFYVWLSVFNLLALSLAWSVLADVFDPTQARRVFALMAAGLSAGGLLGPLLGVKLVGIVGLPGLLLIAAALLLASIAAARRLHRWRERVPTAAPDESRRRALGGSPFAGATTVFRSRYLLGIASFVLLLTSVNTFLYFDQARLVELTFPDRESQYRVFAYLDATVQLLAILAQLFITGHVAQRLGVGVLLVTVPLLVMTGFLGMSLWSGFALFALVMVVRRAGEYGLVRPGREMLFTVLKPESKYKAKNFLDTVVYRGGDVISGWSKAAVDALAQHPTVAALVGALLCACWAVNGGVLARAYGRRVTEDPRAT